MRADTLENPRNDREVWENEARPKGAGNTLRPLTHSSDSSREGLPMNGTRENSRAIEQWLPVVGYVGWYEVSDHGNVRSLPRLIEGAWGPQRLSGRAMKPTRGNSSGHLRVALSRNGITEHVWVHRLVLGAFVGPCPAGMETCHANGIPFDNRLANLRWDSRSANSKDSVRHRTHNKACKDSCDAGHPFTISPDGYRRCKVCNREKDRERTEAIRAAHTALGMQQREYRRKYGSTIDTALRVLADLARDDEPAAKGAQS